MQRGNNRQDVFFVDADRKAYLSLLGEQAARFGLSVIGYCLMTNHVHLIVAPRTADALAKAVGRTDFKYAQLVNRRHNRSGRLWQSRFYSCPLDDRGLLAALVYIEQNPVRAGLVRRAWDYRWSSARAHCGGRDETGLLDMARWARLRPRAGEWRETLRRRQADDEAAMIRVRTSTGRPLGGDSFMSKLEKLLGRRLRPMPPGRPKGAKNKKAGSRGKK